MDYLIADAVRGHCDLLSQKLGKAFGNWGQGVLGIGSILRAPKMRGQKYLQHTRASQHKSLDVSKPGISLSAPDLFTGQPTVSCLPSTPDPYVSLHMVLHFTTSTNGSRNHRRFTSPWHPSDCNTSHVYPSQFPRARAPRKKHSPVDTRPNSALHGVELP